MVTLTFSALSSGFPPPCRQQGPQRAAPWSCSSSGGCHTRGSSQPLSQTAAPHSSHICGIKEGGKGTEVLNRTETLQCAPFCCLHSTSALLSLSAAPTRGSRSGLSTLLGTTGSAAQAQGFWLPLPKHLQLSAGTRHQSKQNDGSGPRGSCSWHQQTHFTWARLQDPYLLQAWPHCTKTLFIFLMLQCKENSIQAWTQILPADFQASASPTTEELLQTSVKIQPSKAKRIKTIPVSNQLYAALLCLLVIHFKLHLK